MITIYINGQKASKKDLNKLRTRVLQGKEYIISKEITKSGNIAIKTI